MKPRVSVIIPTYNSERYIDAAIKSVLSQTHAPAEIIVVDDGSTDGTAVALQPYRELIRYVHQKNSGEPAARNRGLREAGSEYIAFLDADDVWHPNKLELQMAYFEAHPDCAFVYTDMSTFDESGTIDASMKERFQMKLQEGWIFEALFMRTLFGSGSVVLRKECFEKVGHFDESFLIGSDYEMWLRISRVFQAGFVDKPLLLYRQHPGMSTRGLGRAMRNGVPWEVEVLNKVLEMDPAILQQLGESRVNRRMSRPYANQAHIRFRFSDHVESRRLFRKALSYWPTNWQYLAFYLATFAHPTQVSVVRKLYHALARTKSGHATRQAQASATS